MSTPATGEELLELVVKSGLLTHDQVESYAQSEAGSGPDGARLLAEKLVGDGLLTTFQTRQLLAGRTRGYFLCDNKYKALAPLGNGVLGPVILCEDMRLQQRVAVKLLQKAPDKDSGKLGAAERFVRESLTVATMNHPNLVRVFGLEWSAKTPCIVMEFAEGTNLKQVVTENGLPSVQQAVQCVQQAAAGLQHAHAKRLLHREVKPSHLILDPSGVVRIAGFGLTHFFRGPGPLGADPNDLFLQAMGDYMSPEQAASVTPDNRSDTYSLGATLYFLLTGRAPFEAEEELAKPNAHRFRQPPGIRDLRPEVTYGLVEVIGRMMAKNPNERYSSVGDAAAALTQWSRDPVTKSVKLPAAAVKPVAPGPATRREPLPASPVPSSGSGISWGAVPALPSPNRSAAHAVNPATDPDLAEDSDPAFGSGAETPRDSAPAIPTRSLARHVPLQRPPEEADTDTEEPALPKPQPLTKRTARPPALRPAAAAPAAQAPAKPAHKINPNLIILGVILLVLVLGGTVVALIATNAFAPSNKPLGPPRDPNIGNVPNQQGPGKTPGPGAPGIPGKGPDKPPDKNPPDKNPPETNPPEKNPNPPSAGAVQITGSGSTFIKPAMEYWTRLYESKTGVKIEYSGIGSGRGIENMVDKVLDFGCTDSPMTDAELKKAKNTFGEVLHIPLAMGAVVVTYNLDIKQQLRFTGDVLADIYLGKITKWNDPAIVACNPGIDLPDVEITVVHRSDSSGTTAIWTDFLTKVSPAWARKVGTGTKVVWPVGEDAEKNDGVAKAVSRKIGAIGYVELAFALERNQKYGQVRNKAGEYVQPSLESVTAAAKASLQTIPADLRYTLTDPPGEESYPIAGTTWLVMYADQSGKGRKAKGKELVKFLDWLMLEGQTKLKALRYAPLPPTLIARVKEKIATIQTGE